MSDIETIWELERRCWTEGRSFYKSVLSDEAVYAFPPPMGIFAGNAFVDQMGEDGPFTEVAFEDQHVVEAGGAVVLAYRGTGSGGGQTRTSICTSVYIPGPDGWKLTAHHQTPLEA